MKNIGIYIHVPFCAQKCAYCDFYSLAGRDPAGYSKAIINQIKSYKGILADKTVDTIFFGGGTPTILPADYIVEIMSALRAYANVSSDAEITIEANPGTIDGVKLSKYRGAGVNRLSLGLQSADDKELFMLSRIHTKEQFESSFLLARMEGFENINIDLMYALPYQSIGTLANSISYVVQMDPEHVSFYGLKIEENTPFGRHPNIYATLPDEETQVKMYLDSCLALEGSGYKQYEISNFAKEGYECRHNLKYWNSLNYLGFGPGAHSFYENHMFSYEKDLDKFMANATEPENIIDDNYELSYLEASVQYVMLAFRLARGVSKNDFANRFGMSFDANYLDKMQRFIDGKLIIADKNGYRLSRRGMLVSNYILSEILDFGEK